MQNPQNVPEQRNRPLTTREVAMLLRRSPDTVRRRAGQLGGRKMLGRYEFDPAKVAEFAGGAA